MAAMLNTDIKTACIYVLQSKNVSRQLKKEPKIRHIRTVAGEHRFDGTIGDIFNVNKHNDDRAETLKDSAESLPKKGEQNVGDQASKRSVSKQVASRRRSAVRKASLIKSRKFQSSKGMDRFGDSNGNKFGILKSYQLSDEVKKIYEKGKIPTGELHELSPKYS